MRINKYIHRLRDWLFIRLLLFKFQRRRKSEWKKVNKTHYPKKWIRMATIIENDIAGYLRYEGKDKYDILELSSRMYSTIKDINFQLNKFMTIYFLLIVYIISYTFDLNLTLSITGVNLEKKIEILAGVILVTMFIRYHIALLEYNNRVIKTAVATMINESVDVQISGTLKSVFLYFDNSRPYESANSRYLIPVNFIIYTPLIFILISAITYVSLEIGVFYTYYKALTLIYNTSNWSNYFYWSFVTGSVSLLGLSLWLSWYSLLPILYKDWSSNTKMEILDQVDKQKSNEFKKELYQGLQPSNRAINILKARLKKLK